MVHMSEMGERTGNLEKVMLSLSKYYNRQSIIDENIKNAVLYPLMMAVLMAVILGIIITKVLPVFSGIFSQLGLTLSPAAEFLLKAGKILPSAAAVILVLAIILSIAAYLLYKSGRLNIPSSTKISCLIAESRFSSSMALMISSGMDMDDALEMASKLVSHPYVSPKIARLQDLIFDGEMFEDALEKAGLFTDYYRRMLRIGSKSGKLDIMMNETADRMNSNISNRIDSIISGIEPAAVITLSVLAGLILLSVMLPLLSILSSIG